VLAGLAGAWVVVGVGALGQGSVGALAGFDWRGLRLLPTWLPRADLDLGGVHGAGAWTAMLLAGPISAFAVGFAVHGLAEGIAAPAPVRVVAFEVFAAAWLQVPLLMLAGGLGLGDGAIAALYERLGEPESGRWAMVLLGLITLWWAGAMVADQAIAMGGSWLRIDSRRSRRRAVLVMAAYPLVATVVVASVFGAVDRPLWAIGGALVAGAAAWLRTP
jgi:hypothetical protein